MRQLLIGHYSSRYEDEEQLLSEARAIFPPTTAATENLCISILPATPAKGEAER